MAEGTVRAPETISLFEALDSAISTTTRIGDRNKLPPWEAVRKRREILSPGHAEVVTSCAPNSRKLDEAAQIGLRVGFTGCRQDGNLRLLRWNQSGCFFADLFAGGNEVVRAAQAQGLRASILPADFFTPWCKRSWQSRMQYFPTISPPFEPAYENIAFGMIWRYWSIVVLSARLLPRRTKISAGLWLRLDHLSSNVSFVKRVLSASEHAAPVAFNIAFLRAVVQHLTIARISFVQTATSRDLVWTLGKHVSLGE